MGQDSRTNAGVDNFAKFCKMTVFELRSDRVLALLSSGNLAGTQAVRSVPKQRGAGEGLPTRLTCQVPACGRKKIKHVVVACAYRFPVAS